MNNLAIAMDGAWKVLVAGLLLGAGVPTLFALAVNGLATAEGGDAAALARAHAAIAPGSALEASQNAAAIRTMTCVMA